VFSSVESVPLSHSRPGPPSPHRLGGGETCPSMRNELAFTERASSNIALLYGGIRPKTAWEGWSRPQENWTS